MKRKVLSELAALNEEARERHVTYGQLMARTTPREREQIVEKWRKHYASGRTADAEAARDAAKDRRERKAERLRRVQTLYDLGLTDNAIDIEYGTGNGYTRRWREARGLPANRARRKRDNA